MKKRDGEKKSGGVNKAAILLMSLGEVDASKVMMHMEPKEVQAVGSAMAAISNVSKEEVSEVVAGFCKKVEQQTGLGLGNDEYIRNVLVTALGEDKAG